MPDPADQRPQAATIPRWRLWYTAAVMLVATSVLVGALTEGYWLGVAVFGLMIVATVVGLLAERRRLRNS